MRRRFTRPAREEGVVIGGRRFYLARIASIDDSRQSWTRYFIFSAGPFEIQVNNPFGPDENPGEKPHA